MRVSGVKHSCTLSSWLFNVYMGAVITEIKMGIRRMWGFLEEEREWRLYGDDLALCGESKQDVKGMEERFVRS